MAKKSENVCKWVRLARERNERDLFDGHKRGLWFDEEEADRVCGFFPLLTLWEGKFAGQPYKPMKWVEQDILRPLFGWKKLPKGMTAKDALKIPIFERARAGIVRRYRTLYMEIPRKNTKTILGAGIGLYGLVADAESGAQIYSAATKREQAKIMFDCAKNLLDASEDLSGVAQIQENDIFVPHWKSVFKPLSSDFKKQDGFRPHFSLVDEYHEHKTRNLVEKLETGRASDQPLTCFFTTAGDNRHGPCFKEHLYAKHVLEGRLKNDAYLAIIYTIDEDDDWKDPRAMAKANPGLGVSVPKSVIEEEFQAAMQRPSAVNSFKRYRLNIWVNVASTWLKWESWKACAGHIDLDVLKKLPCYMGLDLSWTTDLTALVLVWPPWVTPDNKWHILPYFWVPEERIKDRVEQDKVEYDVWQQEGHLRTTPGNVVDYNFIETLIYDIVKDFNVQRIGYDPYNSSQLTNNLQENGIEILELVRQGPPTLSAPMKEFERAVLSGRLVHNDNPVLGWNVANVVTVLDSNANIKPDKKKSTERIDGVSATLTAMFCALQCKEDPIVVVNGC